MKGAYILIAVMPIWICYIWNECYILTLTGGGGPIMGDLWALKGLIEEGMHNLPSL